MRFRPLALLLIALGPAALAGQEPLEDPLPLGAVARLGTIHHRTTADWLSLSADGKQLFTVSGGRTVARWDAETGGLLGEIHLPGPGTCDGSALSSDGALLATREWEGRKANVYIWDVATGKRLQRIPDRWGPLAFAPDGRTLATSTYQSGEGGAPGIGAIFVWNVATGKESKLSDLKSYARDLVFSPDSKRLYAAVDNHSLHCWDLSTGRELWRNNHAANRLAISPDGKILCADVYLRHTFQLRNADTGERMQERGTSDRETAQLAFSPDGKRIAQSTWSETLVYNLAGGFQRFPGRGARVAFSRDSASLFSADALLQRWDIATRKMLYRDTSGNGHIGAVMSLAFAPDGTLASSGADGTFRFWNPKNGHHRILSRDGPERGARHIGINGFSWAVPVVPLAFTPDGAALLTDSRHDRLALTDVKTGRKLRSFELPQDDDAHEFILSTAAISADGTSIIAQGYGQEKNLGSSKILQPLVMLVAWNAATGVLKTRRTVNAPNWTGALSPDGKLMLMPHGKLFSISREVERNLVDAPVDSGPPLAFSPDGRLLAFTVPNDLSGPAAGLLVYETASGRLLTSIKAALGPYRALAFSHDGRMLAASGRKTLFVWHTLTGQQLLALSYEGRVHQWDGRAFAGCLAFATDGRTLASGHADGGMLLWDLAPARAKTPSPAGYADIESCWADLGGADVAKAWTAIGRLATTPERTVRFLQKHLVPTTVSPRWLAERVADLAHEKFAVREAATQELEKVAPAVEAALLQAQKDAGPEVQRRLVRILKTIDDWEAQPAPPDRLRGLRAIAALERIASSEARTLLRDLSADVALATAAQESLRRLNKGVPGM